MKYIIKDFTNLLKNENGEDINIGEISNKAFAMHIKLYEGYVNNTNIILDKFQNLEANCAEWNELNRRLGWEWNGMRNHELFFESLKPQIQENFATQNFPKLNDKLTKSFGNFENWKKNLECLCKIRGIGWAMLVQDKKTGELLNVWVNEHDAGMLSDVNIILNIDMFEHAYIGDFGTDRQKYLNSIFSHIDWGKVESRLI